jgi:hypothetical protein
MFRYLAKWFEELPGGAGTGATQVFSLHPLQLTRFMEEMWLMRAGSVTSPSIPSALYGVEATSGIEAELPGITDDIYPTSLESGTTLNRVQTRHLIYAYMIENTRAFEIFRRVLEECATGEKLDVPSIDGQNWLRTTEALFFSDGRPGSVATMTSSIRPDIRAVRRNAYYRLLGFDLNHGADDGRPYPYVKPDAANREFVTLFEEFLREVWRGIENITNTSGANPTDDAAIAELGAAMADILTVRRRNGALDRVEFGADAAMSWIHLTLMTDTPIIVDLKATATSPEERLRKLGERVGLEAHRKSEQYFAMADALANILTGIEARLFANAGGVPALYSLGSGGSDNPIRDDMMTIISQWAIASGRDPKADRVMPGASRPARPTLPAHTMHAGLATGAAHPALPAGSASHNGDRRALPSGV